MQEEDYNPDPKTRICWIRVIACCGVALVAIAYRHAVANAAQSAEEPKVLAGLVLMSSVIEAQPGVGQLLSERLPDLTELLLGKPLADAVD